MNVGVYILNVIVNNGSEKTAYETILIILIILAPDQKPVEKTEITKIIQKTKVFVEIDFREEKKCQDGYSYNNKTNECEKINICIAGLKHTDKGCKPLPSPPVEKPQPPMPPTPEPTDRCWDINAGKPMEDCGEEETEREKPQTVAANLALLTRKKTHGLNQERKRKKNQKKVMRNHNQCLESNILPSTNTTTVWIKLTN